MLRTPLLLVLALITTVSSVGCSGPARFNQSVRAFDGTTLPTPNRRHFDRKGEKAEIRLITYADLKDVTSPTGYRYEIDEDGAGNVTQIDIPAPPARIHPREDLDTQGLRSFSAAGAISAVVGFAVDAVQKQLEKEAAKYVQQYKDSIFADDFFLDRGIPKYAGFELIRSTDMYTTEEWGLDAQQNRVRTGGPAFRLVVLFMPAQYDRRIFTLRPVYMRVRSAAAKVGPVLNDERKMTVEANVVLEAAYFAKGEFKQSQVANADLKFKGYSLRDSKPLSATFTPDPMPSFAWITRTNGVMADSTAPDGRTFTRADGKISDNSGTHLYTVTKDAFVRAPSGELRYIIGTNGVTYDQGGRMPGTWSGKLKNRLLGYFMAPPVPGESKTQAGWYDPDRGGTFRLYVAVTETDESRAQKELLRFAEFIGDNKQKIIDAAQSQVPSSP